MFGSYHKYFFKIYGNKLLNKIHLPSAFEINRVLQERGVMDADNANIFIYDAIISGKPFFAGRLGGMEFSAISDYLISKKIFGRPYIRNKITHNLHYNAGFFPSENKQVIKFAEITLNAVKEADLLARWWGGFENYVIEEYAKNAVLTDLPSLEPWQKGVTIPWSAALEGKKVLVIHPFEASIQAQYQKQDKIFPGTCILPRFHLKTLKAVQTIADQQDDRFETWFEALDYMYREAMKIDFDVAIIGCGAYGFPLAAKIKNVGKQAIHLAGATQILFGIKGKRWESKENFGYLHPYFNDDWIYPLDIDVPDNSKIVEGGCYWK